MLHTIKSMKNKLLANLLKPENQMFFVLIIIQLIIQIYFYNRTISQIGINEHGLLGFTTEYHYENVAFNYFAYNQFASGEYPNITTSTYRAPLWPFILSSAYKIFGYDMKIGLIINNIFLFICSIILFLIGKKISRYSGILCVIIFFLDPILIERANSNQSEISYLFLITICIYFLFLSFIDTFKIKYFIIFSVFFALSTFTRPVTLYATYAFAAVSICYYLFKGLKNKTLLYAIIIFIAINIIPIEIWKMRNASISGNNDFVGMKTVHVFNFLAPRALATTLGVDDQIASDLMHDRFIINNKHYEALQNETERNKYKQNVATKVLIENIPGFTKHYFKQVPRLFLSFPIKVPALLYSEEDKRKIYKILKTRTLNIKGKLIKLIDLFNNGFIFYLFYAISIKIFYLLNAFLSLIGLPFMFLKSKNLYQKINAIILIAIYANGVLITCLWSAARYRVHFMTIMAIGSVFALLNIYKLFQQHYRKPVQIH